MMRRTLAFTLIAALSAAAQGAPQWQAPADAAKKQNPLQSRPELAAGGEKLFRRNCMECHGDPKKGTSGKGPNLASEFVQQESDGALFWKMTNGNSRSGMPSFSSLPEAQRWQLILYIRSLPALARGK